MLSNSKRVIDVIRRPANARAELKREGEVWCDVDEFIALFSKTKHGDPYRVEFRLVERIPKLSISTRSFSFQSRLAASEKNTRAILRSRDVERIKSSGFLRRFDQSLLGHRFATKIKQQQLEIEYETQRQIIRIDLRHLLGVGAIFSYVVGQTI
jgi:hypothetical protein